MLLYLVGDTGFSLAPPLPVADEVDGKRAVEVVLYDFCGRMGYTATIGWDQRGENITLRVTPPPQKR